MVLPPGWESRSPPTPHNLGSIKQLIGPLSLNMKAVVNAQQKAEKKLQKNIDGSLETKNKVLHLHPASQEKRLKIENEERN